MSTPLRYRRAPELDRPGVAWEELATGAIRYALPGYDLNSPEAQAADALLALSPEARGEELRAHHAALLAEADAGDVEMLRLIVERQDLGEGLEALRGRWMGREEPGQSLVELGDVEVFRDRTGCEIEIDTNAHDFNRRVHISWPTGEVDSSNTALQLLQLVNLLGRPEVVYALARWANEDAEADRAERARQGEEGGQS